MSPFVVLQGHLGCEILDGTSEMAIFAVVFGGGRSERKAEVGEFDLWISFRGREEDVVRLNIAMDDWDPIRRRLPTGKEDPMVTIAKSIRDAEKDMPLEGSPECASRYGNNGRQESPRSPRSHHSI